MSTPSTPFPTLAELERSMEDVAGAAIHTPLIRLPIDGPDGAPVFAKPESLQRTGSFKLRGALAFLGRLDPETRARGVVTHSSGNHAQGVAFAARHYGVSATIVIPEGAPSVKVEGTLALGAEVVRCRNTQAEREGTAGRIARERGATLVPPYDHPWIVAGQASVGLEIVEDLPDVANVLAPIGGGGLTSGIALALASRAPSARLLGVEPELAADARASLLEGHRVTWPAESVTRTLADGVRTQSIGELNFAILSRHLEGVVAVGEDEIRSATAWYATRAHLVVEPTGALSLAALRRLLSGAEERLSLQPGPSVVVVSGGNVDRSLFCALLQEASASA